MMVDSCKPTLIGWLIAGWEVRRRSGYVEYMELVGGYRG